MVGGDVDGADLAGLDLFARISQSPRFSWSRPPADAQVGSTHGKRAAQHGLEQAILEVELGDMAARARAEALADHEPALPGLFRGAVEPDAEVILLGVLVGLEVLLGPLIEDLLRVVGVDNVVRGPDAGLVARVAKGLRVELREEQDLATRTSINSIVVLESGHLALDLAREAVADVLGVGRLLEVAGLVDSRRPRPASSDVPVVPSPCKLRRRGAVSVRYMRARGSIWLPDSCSRR